MPYENWDSSGPVGRWASGPVGQWAGGLVGRGASGPGGQWAGGASGPGGQSTFPQAVFVCCQLSRRSVGVLHALRELG